MPNEGVRAYNSIGKFFVSVFSQDYEQYNVSLYFTWWTAISFGLILLGGIPIILGITNARYEVWIDKEWRSYKNKNGRK